MQKPSVTNPPPVGCQKRSLDGISWVQKVAAVKKCFRGCLWWFWNICEYIGGRTRSVEPRGAHEGGGRALGGRPLPCHLLGTPLTQPFLLYIHINLRNTRSIHENTSPPPQHSVPMRSHLGAFSGILPEGDSITESFYINSIALPMKREQITSDLRVHSQQLDGFFSLFDSQYHVLLDVLGDLLNVILFCGVFAEI